MLGVIPEFGGIESVCICKLALTTNLNERNKRVSQKQRAEMLSS
jgi:hypothetical protein